MVRWTAVGLLMTAIWAAAVGQEVTPFAADRAQGPGGAPKPKQPLPDFKIDLPQSTPQPPRPIPAIIGTAAFGGTEPLQLLDVIRSVNTNYPLIIAAEAERVAAAGRVITAQGPFDTGLAFTNSNAPLATFENYRFVGGITQAFSDSGTRVFSTYRGGYGDFPGYSGGLKTADGGEFRAGVAYPFLRDGPIDRARANLQQAEINRRAVDPEIDRRRLMFVRTAARIYWTWVAAGERLRIVRALAKLAEVRDQQLAKVVAGMAASPLDRADNLQNLLGRRSAVVEAEREFAQTAVDLSLFLRDNSGQPVLPGLDRVPSFPALMEPDPDGVGDAIRTALARRPEPQLIRRRQEALAVELRWAQNQLLPAVNAVVSGAGDVGRGKPATGPSRLDRYSLDVGFEFQMPFQLSDARGRVMTIQANLAQAERELQFAEETVRADVQIAFVALERTYQLYMVARERVRYAGQVADGERRLYLGEFGDLIRVNIREQQAFDAEIVELGAKLNYFRALADYKVALGIADR